MKYLSVLAFTLFYFVSFAQSPIGTWKTIDDNSGEARSHVTIYEQGDKLFGKVSKLLDEDPKEICTACKGKNANKKILGMVILENMKKSGTTWSKGTILDPETGNTYRCKIWLAEGDANQLKVRGIHWTGLYRTQTWYRVE